MRQKNSTSSHHLQPYIVPTQTFSETNHQFEIQGEKVDDYISPFVRGLIESSHS